MSEIFKNTLITLLTSIKANPPLLERTLPDMVTFLQRQGNIEAQGTGNKVTNQEACFADIAQKSGFTFLAKGPSAPADGLYYLYQLNGTQAAGDFGLREYMGGVIQEETIIDLKHTNGKTFYLNDGWFQSGVIYIVSWNAGTKSKQELRAHIALGEEIPSEEERKFMDELVAFKREKNTGTSKVGSLRPYIRFANQYSCERFIPEVATTHFNSVIASIK
jgi:hypothetical protein